ncbi:MAG: T9SS type A sorting domain-containing protein [Chlorobi bacterium]|nr:T9SS type A sorting domain-containing protein [Chlorobiota bacterium]
MRKTTIKFLALSMFLLMGTWVMGQTLFTVTFNVDMTNADPFDPATDDVYISGSFAGWAQPGSDTNYMMKPTEDNPMIYSITLQADSGLIMWKYFRVIDDTPSWDNGEWNGDPNRITILIADSLTFDNVWANKPYFVTFNVDMSNADPFDPNTDDVYIAGSMAAWQQPGTIPELKLVPSPDNTMVYTITLLMYRGEYQYKYFRVIDGAPSWDNGEWNGEPNRLVTVDTSMVVNDVWADINAGIFDRKAEFTYDMYPNPVTNTLTLSGINDVNKIEIFDVRGKVVRSIEVNSEKVSVNLSDLQSGVYIISLRNSSGIQTTKFIKN